jgi:DNA-binding MarR family transcriptional regulator
MDTPRKSTADSDYELWTMIIHATDLIYDIREKELARYGITPRQAGILTVLDDFGGNVKLADIAQVSNREPNSISTLVQRMERNGLVTKQRDQQRKNVIRVSLTSKGEEVLPLVSNRRSLHRIFSSLSDEEIAQVKASLNKLMARGLLELNRQA